MNIPLATVLDGTRHRKHLQITRAARDVPQIVELVLTDVAFLVTSINRFNDFDLAISAVEGSRL